MPLRRIAVWFRHEDYPAFKRLSPQDPDLPDTYDEWLKLATQQVTNLESQGILVEKAVIDPQEFSDYCRDSGIEANSFARDAFAIKKARG